MISRIAPQALVGLIRPIDVDTGGINLMVYIHVSKKLDSNKNDRAVQVNLDIFSHLGLQYPESNGGCAFRVTSKNCDMDCDKNDYEPATTIPYVASGINTAYGGDKSVHATQRTGTGPLIVEFDSYFSSEGRQVTTGDTTSKPILKSVDNFSLLPCNSLLIDRPDNVIDPYLNKLKSLITPFFYKDINASDASKESSFFVQPSLVEQADWVGWAIPPSEPDYVGGVDVSLGDVPVAAQTPKQPGPINTGDP